MNSNDPKTFRNDEFWRTIPLWSEIDYETFIDHKWQEKNAVSNFKKLIKIIADVAEPSFLEDAQKGFDQAPMAVRISPYLLSLMDWNDPVNCPIRRQFLPLASQLLPDHPMLQFDSLGEQADAPVTGLTHRYPDKVLFLALDTCPVYCRFCTRSYAVGTNTLTAEKVSIKASRARWKEAFDYIRSNKLIEDVVISGGDSYRLKPEQIYEIGEALLSINHIRRFRFATKGLSVIPMKLLTDEAWTDAVSRIVANGRREGKEVTIHTHFNHANEITHITKKGLDLLFQRGIKVRNQTVLQHNVNDKSEDMITLVKKMSYLHVQPYYVYVHDLVKGTEDMRTSVKRAMDVESHVRGITAGFNTPLFVVDAPGGGGKRDVHSMEWYDVLTGISVWTAPSVKPGQKFLYFDPLHSLQEKYQALWQDPQAQKAMIKCALDYHSYSC